MSALDQLFVLGLPLVPHSWMRRLGSRYVAGEDRADAVALALRLENSGYQTTCDLLGEKVRHEEDVQAALAEYQSLAQDLRRENLQSHLSVKPTQFGIQLSEALCLRTVHTILENVRHPPRFVRFEMEDSSTTDATLRVFSQLRARHGSATGCVLQSMLHRCEEDARTLLQDSAPLDVRLVKGIYVEPPDIAFQKAKEIRDSYLRTAQSLLAGGARLAAATHDEILIAGLEDLLQNHPEWTPQLEIQMLLGVREPLRHSLRKRGLPVRVYLPYGASWLPYVMRRLRKNPKMARYALWGLLGRRESLAGAESSPSGS